MDFIKPHKVIVSFISNIKTGCFVLDDIHEVDIVINGISNILKTGYGSFNII